MRPPAAVAAGLCLLLFVVGCRAAAPAAPTPDPVGPGNAPVSAAEAAPAPAALREGCKAGEVERGTLAPRGPAGPVQVRAYLQEDPGIAAPIHARITALPVTVQVEFDQPVNRDSFALTLSDTRCDYAPGPIDQETRWLSDRAAAITVHALPAGKPGPYAVSLGHGKDRAGLEVREPNLRFSLESGLPRQEVYAVPLAGGEPRLLYHNQDDLQPSAVSPDGRYLLAVCRIMALSSSHSPVRIPYVVNLGTGDRQAYSRGPVEPVYGDLRWDLAGHALWVSGWQRLALDGTGDTGQGLLDRLPAGDGYRLNAKVSPDGRWLAALQTPRRSGESGRMDLVVVDLNTGATRTLRDVLAYQPGFEGPQGWPLEWAADSGALLINSVKPGTGPEEQVVRDLVRVDPANLAHRILPVHPAAGQFGHVLPGGGDIAVGGYGIVRPDGTAIRRDATLSVSFQAPVTSADGRYFLAGSSESEWSLVAVATGRRTPVARPPGLDGTFVLGLSADGSTLYLGRQVGRYSAGTFVDGR